MKYSQIIDKYGSSEKNKETAQQQREADQLRKKKKNLRNKLQNAKDAKDDKQAEFEKAVAADDNVTFDAVYLEVQAAEATVAMYEKLWKELGFDEEK